MNKLFYISCGLNIVFIIIIIMLSNGTIETKRTIEINREIELIKENNKNLIMISDSLKKNIDSLIIEADKEPEIRYINRKETNEKINNIHILTDDSLGSFLSTRLN